MGRCEHPKCRGGGFSYINARTSIENASIGRYCAIAHDTKIGLLRHDAAAVMMTTLDAFFKENSFGSDENAKIAPTPQNQIRPKRTNIGHGVWIGAHAIIPANKDISIANGAIIAAGAVLSKDAPPYAIMAGNPARVVKMRFSDEIIADLENSKWWEYDFLFTASKDEKIANFLPLKDPNEFISWWRNEGCELMKEYKISGQKARIFRENGELKLQKL